MLINHKLPLDERNGKQGTFNLLPYSSSKVRRGEWETDHMCSTVRMILYGL